jgi:TonB family protein
MKPDPYVGRETPAVLTRTEPVYPPAARDAAVEGTVSVLAYVGADGRVRGMEIAESIPPLDAAALASSRGWTFHPPRPKGAPVPMQVTIPVTFRLDHAAEKAARHRHVPIADWDVPRAGLYFVHRGDARDSTGEAVYLHHRSSDSLWIECRDHWTSTGVVTGRTYRGAIAWEPNAADSLHRSARGTLTARLLSEGGFEVRSDYGAGGPPPLADSWKPGGGTLSDQPSFLYSWTEEWPSNVRHPLWQPGRDPDARQEEPPVWPPLRSKPDASIQPATPARADSTGR